MRKKKAGVGSDREPKRSQTQIVSSNQVAAGQRCSHYSCRIEWMESLTNVLQDQDVSAIVYPWNSIAEAQGRRSKAPIAAFTQFVSRFAFRQLNIVKLLNRNSWRIAALTGVDARAQRLRMRDIALCVAPLSVAAVEP